MESLEPLEPLWRVIKRICKEFYNLISSRKKIGLFTQIIIAFILISLAHKFEARTFTRVITPSFKKSTKIRRNLIPKFDLSPVDFIHWVISSLPTSACIYTLSCIYTGREELVTLKKVMDLKVWVRLFITLLCSFSVLLASLVAVIPIYGAFGMIANRLKPVWICLVVIGAPFIMYLGLFTFEILLVCELAQVVSVVEGSYGFEALRKSRQLPKGDYKIKMATVVIYTLISVIDDMVAAKVFDGVKSLILLGLSRLFWLLVLTLIYYVCKPDEGVCKPDEHEDVNQKKL